MLSFAIGHPSRCSVKCQNNQDHEERTQIQTTFVIRGLNTVRLEVEAIFIEARQSLQQVIETRQSGGLRQAGRQVQGADCHLFEKSWFLAVVNPRVWLTWDKDAW